MRLCCLLLVLSGVALGADPAAAEQARRASELPFADALPDFLFRGSLLRMAPWQWLGLLVLVLAAAALAVVFERLSLALGRRMARFTAFRWDDELVDSARGPLRLTFWAAMAAGGTRYLAIPETAQRVADIVVRSLVIVAVAWFLLRFIRRASEQLGSSVIDNTPDGARVRALRTQVAVLRRVLEIAIYLVGAALVLIQFEAVRNVGVSLLASAGIAGLVIGLAAQKSITALLAGIQLSLTQPIRIGDLVSIEGEVGDVEEIGLTYVVVKVWDLRRLVVPVTFFLDNRFQNWTRGDLQMLGTVFLEADWRIDVDAVRAELQRLLALPELAQHWDGKVASVVVADSKERTVQLRILVSAKVSVLYDLRAALRERLIAFIRQRPEWLPTTRLEPAATPPRPAGPGIT